MGFLREDRGHLRWFRDRGRGQEAADATGAEQVFDGSWPVAVLPCPPEEQWSVWDHLLETFDVNAMYYYPLVKGT